MYLNEIMKIKIITIIIGGLIFISSKIVSQTNREASIYFMKGNADSAIILTNKIISAGKANAETYIIKSRALVYTHRYQDALPVLQKVLTYDRIPPYAEAGAKHDLGVCNFYKGDYEQSKKYLDECINMTPANSVTKSALFSYEMFGFSKEYDNWIKDETAHFIFHFQDTSRIRNVNTFIKRNEMIFDSLNKFFGAALNKKYDYFVWADTAKADSVFHKKLPFNDGVLCVTHTANGHSSVREIVHMLSSNIGEIKSTSKLISEGISNYFDLSKKDNLSTLKKQKHQYSIEDIWKGAAKISQEELYPLSAELVKRLIALGGKEKMLQLLLDQSYQSAQKIYGEDLRPLIKQLEKETGG
jgi:tetratricopeptide (TPR) repeat protein